MRSGAIFARGSCRALKWMALFGVMFALVAGQAAAQVKITAPKTADEGGRVTISVAADIRVPTGAAADTLTITTAIAAGTADSAKLLSAAEPADYVVPGALVIATPANTSTATPLDTTVRGTITIQLQSDADAEDEAITVTFTKTDPTVTGTDGSTLITNIRSTTALSFKTDDDTKNITINDTDDQEFVWKVTKPAKPNEKEAITVTLTADPAPVDLTYTTALRVDTMGYSLDPSSHTFAIDDTDNTNGMEEVATVMITPPNPDKNRDTDTIMVEATVAGTASSRVAPLSIEVADIHALPMADKISAKAFMDDGEGKASKNEAMSVMEGGDPVHVTVTVDRGSSGYPDGEKLKVSVMADASQALDYRVDPATVEIADGTGEKSATFKLWAMKDDDVGEEDLMLTLTAKGDKDDNGSGEVMQTFSIAIEDDTTAKVWAKDGAMDAVYGARDEAAGDDEQINPGENFDIMTDDLFGHLPTVTVDYAASSDNSTVSVSASGEKIMVMPQDMEGTAKITVTATATDKASSFQASQVRSDVARIMFEVDVMRGALSVSVAADPMTIMEGEMSTITATADREVAASDGEVKVDLQVVGGGTLSADSITIAAGEMTGTAMVTADQDDDYEDGMLTVIARGAGEATIEIAVTDDDEMPEPTNLITAKSSADIQMVLEGAGLGDDDMFNPGATAMVDASMLFDAADGVSVTYAAESDDMAAVSTSVSSNMVSVMGGSAGHAHVTITATATMASGIEIHTGQPDTNVATVMFSVNVTNTPLAITVSTDPMDMVEEGGMITVTATANRDVVADDGDVEVMLTITGAVEMNEMTIAIAAGSSGTAMVQVLDDMEVAPLADITIVATGSGIATPQTFTISVTENDSARTFTLSAPDDMMNLVEGGDGVELTVTADPAVSEDTEVMIMVDRAASTAGADDFTAAAVMISAGETSGTTMLMATEDDMPDSGHGSPEMLVVFAMADNTQSNTVSFYIWDMAVPALPLIAQLLLAAFLAIGGYRRYLRR